MSWPPASMRRPGHGTHLCDPISGEAWFFPGGPKEAQPYYDLAIKYFVSFREISQMAIVVLEQFYDFDGLKVLDDLGQNAEHYTEKLEKLKLPIREALRIWFNSRDALLQLAEMYPERAEEIEATILEQQARLFAIIERQGEFN